MAKKAPKKAAPKKVEKEFVFAVKVVIEAEDEDGLADRASQVQEVLYQTLDELLQDHPKLIEQHEIEELNEDDEDEDDEEE